MKNGFCKNKNQKLKQKPQPINLKERFLQYYNITAFVLVYL